MDLIASPFHFLTANSSSLQRRSLLLLPPPPPPRLRCCRQHGRSLRADASRRSTDFRLDCNFPALLTSKPRGMDPSSCVVRGVASPRPEPDAPRITSPKPQVEEPILLGLFRGGRARFLVAISVATACGVFVFWRQRILASHAALDDAGLRLSLASGTAALLKGQPKLLRILHVLKEQGLILAALLGLSAFFSMAETSITTLWPWKVRELAEKEPEDDVLRMLSGDVTRFLTTILIGTTVVNIGATALVTEAATAIFGEAGVTAATGIMTVGSVLCFELSVHIFASDLRNVVFLTTNTPRTVQTCLSSKLPSLGGKLILI